MSSCISGFSEFSSEFANNLNKLFDGDLSAFNQNDDNENEYDKKVLDEKDLILKIKFSLKVLMKLKKKVMNKLLFLIIYYLINFVYISFVQMILHFVLFNQH